MTKLYWWEKGGNNVIGEKVVVSDTLTKDLLNEIDTLKKQLIYKENVINSLNQQFANIFNTNSSNSSNITLARSDIIQLQNDVDNDLRDLISIISGLKTMMTTN